MEPYKRVLLTLILMILLIISLLYLTGAITRYTGYIIGEKIDKDAEFKNCLSEKNIILYINTENPDVTLKEIKLNEYLSSIKIFNCLRNNDLCQEKNINNFPTWIIDDNKIENDISLEELKEYSKCKMF